MNSKGNGFYIDADGYRRIKLPSHHMADKQGYVKEHFIFAEKIVGRVLAKGEMVHHTDLSRGAINPFGLIVCSDKEHKTLHIESDAFMATGDKNKRRCYHCKIYDFVDMLHHTVKKGISNGYRHSSCHSEYNKKFKNKTVRP